LINCLTLFDLNVVSEGVNSLEQNTETWLQWRRKGLGSSDVPIILGISRFKTPLQLYQEKLGLKESRENDAMYLGHKYENKARALFEFQRGISFAPRLVQSKQYPFLRASLDGWNQDENVGCEIKYVGKQTYIRAQAKEIPEEYMAQIQYQIFITSAEVFYYVAYFNEFEKIEIVPVYADQDLMKSMLPKLFEFWNRIKIKDAPPMTDRDKFEIEDEALKEKVLRWKNLKIQIDNLDQELLKMKNEIAEAMPHAYCEAEGVRMKRYMKRGNIDLTKVDLKGVDIEKFRKKSTEVISFTIIKDRNAKVPPSS